MVLCTFLTVTMLPNAQHCCCVHCAGFELGIRTMQPGGKRRIVVPPELGPPVGPSTFFSAKQCEVRAGQNKQ